MDVSALLELRGKIDAILAGRRQELQAQLAAFESNGGGHVIVNPRTASPKVSHGKTGKRAKAVPKYQSKKDRSVKWSGRGMMPIWMRDEMKGTKLKRDDFLIS
jgi:DNA-binding protein H-NS